MPIGRRTAGSVISEEKAQADYRARLDERRAREEQLERDKLATENRKIDVDAGIRNRLAGIQSRQVGLEGRRVGELEKTGEVERGLATRQEDRLSGEQSFLQGLRERKLALDVGKTFESGEAADRLIRGETDFGITEGLTPRTTPTQRNLQFIKPTFDEEGNPLTQGGVFDPTSGRFGSPDSFAKPSQPPVNPIEAARQRFQEAMTPPSMRQVSSTPTVPSATTRRDSVSGKPEDIIKKPAIDFEGGKKRAAEASKKAKVSQTERRDKAILGRLAKKKKSGKMTPSELSQFNNLSKKYIK